MRRLRVLVLMRPDLVPPEDWEGHSDAEINEWKTEYDVVTVLREVGHDVRPLGVQHELHPIREAVLGWKPHVVFNLLEEFHGEAVFDQNVVSYLELLRVPYTGCGPRGMVLARGKALAKKLLAYHRIKVPAFAVFPIGRRVRRPERLAFPLIVKSLIEHASLGIAQASLVETDEKLVERVEFVHRTLGTDAIAEEYIEGRELYVGVLGNTRLQVLPVWELVFTGFPPNVPRIATAKVKHDTKYQEKRGIDHRYAKDLSGQLVTNIERTTKRIYRVLELDGYARIDYRLAEDGTFFFLEANPNPEIADGEEFAAAAQHAGIGYDELLQRVVSLGLRRHRG
jgi:D-alanine-D-alanine ligase